MIGVLCGDAFARGARWLNYSGCRAGCNSCRSGISANLVIQQQSDNSSAIKTTRLITAN